MELYNYVNYKSDIKYIFSNYIREYDIRQANINMLLSAGVIDKEIYDRLSVSTREKRQIEIGLMIKKNPELYSVIAEGIINAKKLLFEANNIQPYEVLSIKNDAVFIIGRPLKYTAFGNIQFVNKHTYTSFVELTSKPTTELFYSYNKVTGEEDFTVKGISKNLYLHDEYLNDFFMYIFNQIESVDMATVITDFNIFYKQYIGLELDPGFYREYNSDSMFSILNSPYKLSEYYPYMDKDSIDIGYNLTLLRNLFSYLSSAYFSYNSKTNK